MLHVMACSRMLTPSSVHTRAVFLAMNRLTGVFLKGKSASNLIAIMLIYARWSVPCLS